jgi:hypothetical protein
MQLQELKRIPNNPPVVVEFNYTPVQEYFSISPPISTGNISQTQEWRTFQEYALVTLGKQLATWLTEVLAMLRTYNEQAIYPIVSILDPYMETTSGMDFSFPPKSSRKVTVEVTRKGKVTPTIYFDE